MNVEFVEKLLAAKRLEAQAFALLVPDDVRNIAALAVRVCSAAALNVLEGEAGPARCADAPSSFGATSSAPSADSPSPFGTAGGKGGQGESEGARQSASPSRAHASGLQSITVE